MRTTGARRGAVFGLALALLAGAAAARDVTVDLRGKRIENLSGAGLTLVFQLEAGNASEAAVRLVRYTYRVAVGQKEYLRMPVILEAPIPVGAHETVYLELGVRITYANLAAVVGPLGERAACDVSGEFVFADDRRRETRVPVAFSGDFPIFADPGLDFLPLRVNSLSVGGADLVFEAEFHNPLGYDLLLDRLSFKLELGPQTVLEGEVEGEKSLPAHGDRLISLPILLDFFETGKDMAGLLTGDTVPCRFSGDILIASAWGRLAIKFDKQDALAVVRSAGVPSASAPPGEKGG
jgi:hypothetical protein